MPNDKITTKRILDADGNQVCANSDYLTLDEYIVLMQEQYSQVLYTFDVLEENK